MAQQSNIASREIWTSPLQVPLKDRIFIAKSPPLVLEKINEIPGVTGADKDTDMKSDCSNSYLLPFYAN